MAPKKPKQPSPAEVVNKALDLVRSRVALVSGRSMAAVLLDKREGQVTNAEALAAETDVLREPDPMKQGRAIRAGWLAASAALEREGLLPGLLPIHLRVACAGLDKGEARGMALPMPAPKRTKKAAARLDHVRVLAFHVHRAMGQHNISKEHALVAVTGLPGGKNDRKYTKVMEPVAGLRMGLSYAVLSKRLAEGEKDWGKATLAGALALGEASKV